MTKPKLYIVIAIACIVLTVILRFGFNLNYNYLSLCLFPTMIMGLTYSKRNSARKRYIINGCFVLVAFLFWGNINDLYSFLYVIAGAIICFGTMFIVEAKGIEKVEDAN